MYVRIFFLMDLGKFRTTADTNTILTKYFVQLYICQFASKSSGWRNGVVVVQHLLHHVKAWVPLVVACDSKTKLLVDVDRCLVVIPDIGDDVVDVPLFRLLKHLLHQLLGHALPPVPVEGANEAKVETIVVSELATSSPGQHVIPVSEECKSRILFDKLTPLVCRHVRHSEDWEDLLVDIPEQG